MTLEQYFALSYQLTDSSDESSAIMICSLFDMGTFEPTFRAHRDLPIRNLLVRGRIIPAEVYLDRVGVGVFNTSSQTIKEVTENLASEYTGNNIRPDLEAWVFDLPTSEAERFFKEKRRHSNFDYLLVNEPRQ